MGIEHEGLTLEGRETLKGMREILSKVWRFTIQPTHLPSNPVHK